VSYRVFGSGYPLFLIMGYGSTMNLWESSMVRQLASRFQVIIFDNRGMGNTATGTREFSIEQFADDTSGLMDALGVSQAHVLGWSMGSLIAQELALRHPAKVNKLILYAAYSDGSMFPAAPEVLQSLANTSGTPQERGMRYISVLFPGSWLRNNGERVKEIFFRPMGNIAQATLARQVMAIEAWKGSSDRLGAIHHRTLLIAGAEDVLVVPKNALYLKDHIAGAQLVLMEHAGHGLMFQYPDAFSETVRHFLE
jgi:pimeloyl-ACP methyl ester carboxylesterase